MSNHERALETGLLGHWPGIRSPEGHVRDRSPENNHGSYGLDARWIWFTNPRAVRHADRNDRTYVCYLGGASGKDIVLAAYDHDRRTLERTTLDETFSDDDHTNPSVLVREDGHLVVFWTGHNGDAVHYAVSSEPESIDTFGETTVLEQNRVTYPNPIQLDAKPGNPIALFYRDRIYTEDTTDDPWGYQGDGNLFYRTSEDGGETWSDETLLLRPPGGHYSMYAVPACRDGETVHFFFTDAERGGDAPKWNVMHAAFRDGRFYRADGTEIGGEDDFPLRKDDLEVVYDSADPDNHYAWIQDVAVDPDGHPVAVYSTFPSTLSHEYRYARWTGEEWADHHLADAGKNIAQRPIELHYSGGLSLDRDDPSVVYGCVAGRDSSVLKRFQTDTGGETWSERVVAAPPNGYDLRPVVPRNASSDVPVLWLRGSYKHMDTSQTVLRGLPADHLQGSALEADGSHGVDLGLDLYDASAFVEGVTVAGEVTVDDPAHPGVVANFGGGIKLTVGVESPGALAFGLAGDDGRTAAAWDGLEDGDTRYVVGSWDGDRIRLVVDGEEVASEPFAGPLSLATPDGSWTLLKDEYLLERGFRGSVRELRLYNRPLEAAERDALRERTRERLGANADG